MNTNLAYDDRAEKTRVELIGGEVVSMSPRPSFNHNQVSYNIATLFANYLKGKTCTPIADGMDLYLSEENQFVPDFMIVCDPDKIQANGVHGAPDLVAEVLSPSTMRNDKTCKKDVYARCGVMEYWIVDPAGKSIEIYRADGADFALHDIYALHSDWELEQMSEEERAALVTHFKCSLFDDLDISLEDIFYRTF